MKTIDLGANQPDLRELLKLADSEGLILRTEAGREYVLVDVDDLEQEVELIRRNPELMQLLEERWKDETAIPLDEAKRRLGL